MMQVKVFSMKGCPHCDNLKKQLKENNIEFLELDVDEHEELYENFTKKVGNDFLPAILMGKNAFVPDRSFQTINEAVELVKKHLLQD
jgi:glutaredoxin